MLITYFVFRFYCLLYAESIGGRQLALAWFFVAIELIVLVPNTSLYFIRLISPKRPQRPRFELCQEIAPAVDVLITCCGEDNDLVLDTVRAACALNYPRNLVRVLVLDDGASAELSRSVETLRQSLKEPTSSLYYTAREKPPVKDYKAGNLNHGLNFIKALPNPPADFVAGLDADMIPEPEWLRRMIPHLLANQKMGLVNPPQSFYNVPPGDILRQDLSEFYQLIEVIHDALGSASCSGSGWVARREALDQVHGFPTDTLSEDICCSSLLHGAGWETAYISADALQWGCVPESYLGHVKQRTRWALGTIQTALKLRLRLFGPLVTRLTPLQRTSQSLLSLISVTSPLRVFALFGFPLALCSGYPFIIYFTRRQLRWLLRAVSASELFGALHTGTMVCIAGGWKPVCADGESEAWMIPYYTLTILTSLLPRRLGGRSTPFTPTNTLSTSLHERSLARRSPLLRRLRFFILSYHVWAHLLLIFACAVGCVLGFVRAFASGVGVRDLDTKTSVETGESKWIYLLTHIAWPPVLWAGFVTSCLKPVVYMLCPPNVPERENLLARDCRTGAAYPTPRARERVGGWTVWLAVARRVGVWVWCGLCLGMSWYI
ncbi:glycosyltransferase family 2 protein [Glonium stellatum]|uniref:Glycosyltransferase family 2 protein n=1 Tax=Glonium stellatum TaxID=574774 RepID=A0A8E2JQT8_9PEZI|nr:glycosyltransferase family 2 protein [Glonium stellatum]